MKKSVKNKLESFYRFLIYTLPAVLFFSYFPLIHFGSDESMNFEISLPLIWLVIFDILVFYFLIRRKKIISEIISKWTWLLFPTFLTFSVLWSLNSLRGFLTVGILWLLYFAVFGFFSFKDLIRDRGFSGKFLKVFFGSSLVVCLWCFLQCILDVAGVSREYSLMCAGCTYSMFGFPHPNGFAAEPQFMGNLLLAPTIIVGWMVANNCNNAFRGRGSSLLSSRGSDSSFLGRNLRVPLKALLSVVLLFIFTATLFLTLSRGAIYSFIVAMIVMTIIMIIRTKAWRALMVWPVIVFGFLFTLNMQGIMAEVSKTDDTYISGIDKVVNQMSLGVIDLVDNESLKNNSGEVIVKEAVDEKSEVQKEEAHFDGYVEYSTDMRLGLSSAALSIWAENPKNMLVGVGLGGTSKALSEKNAGPTTKEIVNNQYVSLLLETGIIGLSLMLFSLYLVFRALRKNRERIPIFTLILAYAISLFFFAGLPNALHIYLLSGILALILSGSCRELSPKIFTS